MDWLKKHWGNIMAIAGPLIAFLLPSLHSYADSHPKTVIGVIIGALVWLYNSRAPKDKAPNA